MKKYSILFVVLAVVSLTCVAFAQENDYSEYLGVWYADTACYGGEYFPTFVVGSQRKLEIRDDFTVTLIAHYVGGSGDLFYREDRTMTGQWYTESDTVYAKLSYNDDPSHKEFEYKFELDEEGNLIRFFSDGDFEIYTRDLRNVWGKGPVKENAELEDFLGKWVVYATGNPKWEFAVHLVSGMLQYVDEGTLNVEKDNIDINIEAITLWYVNSYESTENVVLNFNDVPFEIKNGRLVGTFTGKNGRQPFVIEYHTENALVMTVNPGEENESIHVFVTEEDMKNGPEKYIAYVNSRN